MNEDVAIEGIVQAPGYNFDFDGKQFLGAKIVSSDGTKWVIDYDERSPFHVFDGREVIAAGASYQPQGQFLLGVEHVRVSNLRLKHLTEDAPLIHVGSPRNLSGQFAHFQSKGRSWLLFQADGQMFSVFNRPPGARPNTRLDVTAYPVSPPPSSSDSGTEHLWVIPPASMDDLWSWRERIKTKRPRT